MADKKYPSVGTANEVTLMNSKGNYETFYIPHVWMSANTGLYLRVFFGTRAEADEAAKQFVESKLKEQEKTK